MFRSSDPPLAKSSLVPVRKHLEHLLKKQYAYGYMVFFNMNICRNNTDDVRTLTEYAHDHRIATHYHINETPMLEQDENLKHLSDNPTYNRPEDWPEIDSLVDWLIEKNRAGRLPNGQFGADLRLGKHRSAQVR